MTGNEHETKTFKYFASAEDILDFLVIQDGNKNQNRMYRLLGDSNSEVIVNLFTIFEALACISQKEMVSVDNLAMVIKHAAIINDSGEVYKLSSHRKTSIRKVLQK